MSQVSFKTLYMDFPVEVVVGWDEPLQYYHFTVFDLRADAEEECIYSCLDERDIFSVTSTDRWKAKLEQMRIVCPDGFWDRANRKEGSIIYRFNSEINSWNK